MIALSAKPILVAISGGDGGARSLSDWTKIPLELEPRFGGNSDQSLARGRNQLVTSQLKLAQILEFSGTALFARASCITQMQEETSAQKLGR